jgi:hypothetical protein
MEMLYIGKMTECPNCKSHKVTEGRLADRNRSLRVTIQFIPGELKWFQFSMAGGAELQPQAFACEDCGMVWTRAAYPEVLRDVIQRFGKPKKDEPSGLTPS